MHYLNLLTVRLYTFLAVLPNYLPDWLRHGTSLVKVPYNISSWANFNGETMKQLYNNPDGSQIAKFYIYFSKYLRETRPMYTIVSHIGGHIAEFMYDVSNDMEKIYIHLFSMFGFISQQGELQRWYKYVQYVGWAVFLLLLIIYGVGMIFNMHGGFARMKDLITGMLIATSIIFILPWLTNLFSTGLQKTADAVLGDPRSAKTSDTIISGNKNDTKGESLADSIVKNNVVSIPNMTTYAAMRGIPSINIKNHPDIFQPTHQKFSDGVPSQPYYINLYHMQNDSSHPQDITNQKDVWNGIGSGSTGQFLGNIGGDGSYLDKATINHNTDFVRKNIGDPSFYGGMNIWANKQAYGMESGLMAIPAFLGSKRAQQVRRNAQGQIDASKYQNDVATRVYAPYKYHIQGNGDDAEFTELNQFVGGNSFMTGFRSSYGTYQVNWFNIFLGLITLISMLIGLLIKLSNGFYKMLIMYVSSGWFLMKNASHHDKIKDFVRAFFGIFENLVLDLLILRLFVIAFVYINSFVAQETVVPLSPLAIGLVQAALSYGLFKVESQGINTLSSQLSGQGNQTGNGLGSLATLGTIGMGLRTARHAASGAGHMATRGAGKGIKSAGHYGRNAIGGWQRERAKKHGGTPGSKTGKNLRSKMNTMTGKSGNGSQRTTGGNSGTSGGGNDDEGEGLMTSSPTTASGAAGAASGFLGRKLAAGINHRATPDYHGYSLNRQGGSAFHPGKANASEPHYTGHPNNTSVGSNQNGSKNTPHVNSRADSLAHNHHIARASHNIHNGNTNRMRHGFRNMGNIAPKDNDTNIQPSHNFSEQTDQDQGQNEQSDSGDSSNQENDDGENNEDNNNNDSNDRVKSTFNGKDYYYGKNLTQNHLNRRMNNHPQSNNNNQHDHQSDNHSSINPNHRNHSSRNNNKSN